MRFPYRAAAALLVLTAGAAPLAAQTNTFVAGSTVNSPALTGFSTTGGDMLGMDVTLTLVTGASFSTAWSDLGGGVCGATFGGFSVTLGCGSDSFTSTWSVVNGADAVSSVRFNGAPGRTLFDCGWTGTACVNNGQTGGGVLEGTPGSATGWSLETIAGGSYLGSVSGFYTNIVAVGGAAAVGDLYEQLTIRFDDNLLAGATYNFRADTDNSDFRLPPPTLVPEPSTYALMLAGLLGIGVMARRRRHS